MEQWKVIKGFEGYEVSNLGQVRSIDRTIVFSDGRIRTFKGHLKKLTTGSSNYLLVDLTIHHKSYKKLVHRLVAEAFLPNPNNLPQINHKDENSLNNNVENLEWCSAIYNIAYSREKINRGIKRTYKKVYVYNISGKLLNIYDNTILAADYFKVKQGSIANACKNLSTFKKQYVLSYSPLNKSFFSTYTIGKCKMVYELDKENNIIRSFKSNKEAALFYNKTTGYIASICTGNIKSSLKLTHQKPN